MAFLDVLLERRAPQVMHVARIQILRGGIHNQEFLAKRALPSNAAELSEECKVMSHGASMR